MESDYFVKKEKNNKLEKEFLKLYNLTLEMSNNDIDFAIKRIKIWEDIRKNHYDNEPPKLFKNKHIIWENKLNEINKTLHKIYIDLEVIIDDHYKLIN